MRFLFAAFFLSSQAAQAMPCDVSAVRYQCRSATSRYSFELLTCGFDAVSKSWSLKVAGAELEEAQLEKKWIGAAFLGFEISGEDKNGKQTLVKIEVSQKNLLGSVMELSRQGNPAPWSKVKLEAIRCTLVDESL